MAQLRRAAANGNLEKVIELRSDWAFQNKKGESVLHVAVAEDQLEIVRYLVANGAMLNLQEKKHRFTPLMLALAQQPPSFEEIFQTILKGKPDLNVQDSSGQTVLHLATGLLGNTLHIEKLFRTAANDSEYEEETVLKLLLKAKANVNAVDMKKISALHIAVGKGNLEIVQLLIERVEPTSMLLTTRAIHHCNVLSICCLEARVHPKIIYWRMCRHWACTKNGDSQLEMISYLISKVSEIYSG
ncbi:hypothetical protein PsorP6_012532 [Peronosclerospora sorghi]|uniref:Uncharacterized protein n=1 Tax=Peronosclerospora sorghi TaxID=230839 RepID=A0ACC0WJ37_9STRA|nr:hypothetical protein PsorP6_012532 [Peronosclerospora sorghi]